MRFKICIALLLLLAAIGIVVSAFPATAASTLDAPLKDLPDSVKKNVKPGTGGYVVKFVKSNPLMMRAMGYYGTIYQGEYQYVPRSVYYYTESLYFNLNWGNTQNSLRLRIYTPDNYLLGPFYDWDDGSTNGNIYALVTRPGGVAQGVWYSEVYGHRVYGSQSYSI